MRKRRRLGRSRPFTIGTSRVASLAVDTSLGIQGVPVCLPKCGRCNHRRCRC